MSQSANHAKRWQEGPRVEIKGDAHPPWQPFGSEARAVADLWRAYSLFGNFLRSVPYWIDETRMPS